MDSVSDIRTASFPPSDSHVTGGISCANDRVDDGAISGTADRKCA